MLGNVLGTSLSVLHPSSLRPIDEWKGKPFCKSEWQSRCCTNGYDIEGTLDKAYENGLDSHPLVKKLEDYPCITLKTFRNWTDKLSDLAFERMEDPEALEKQRSTELQSVSEAIRAFEKSNAKDTWIDRTLGASPSRSKKDRSRVK